MTLTVSDDARTPAYSGFVCGVRRGYSGEKALEQTADPWSAPVTKVVMKASRKTQYFYENRVQNQQTEKRLTRVSYCASNCSWYFLTKRTNVSSTMVLVPFSVTMLCRSHRTVSSQANLFNS